MSVVRPLASELDFLALPESMERVELLDGEVIVAPAPSVWHQEVLLRLVSALRTWAATRQPAPFVGMSPLDVRFGAQRILQPDAFVMLVPPSWDQTGPIDRVPELCIEVLSTNPAYDRLTKRVVYAAAGVAEYWIVEPAGLVERWHGGGLVEREEHTVALASPILPGLSLELAAIFRR